LHLSLSTQVINERGVALYNSGDVRGCANAYANTIVDILDADLPEPGLVIVYVFSPFLFAYLN
jgi:hypothetical protein